jgi:hypothetical protein
MTTVVRRRLPNRRASLNFNVRIGGLKFNCTASEFHGGGIGELFLDCTKAGSQVGAMASDAAIAASLALQYGCGLETLRKALCRDGQGRASSPLAAALDLLAEEGGRR